MPKPKTLKIAPHTPAEIRAYATALGVSASHLDFIETLRGQYIAWEHDYVKTQKQSPEEVEPSRD